MVLLEKISVGAAGASSVTFSGIPQTGYTDLVVKMSGRDGASSVIDGAVIRFNNDTTSGNYTARRLIGSGSAATSDTNNVGAFAVGNTATANTFSNCEFYIPNYTGSSYKSVSFDNVAETNATTQYMGLAAFLWSNTAAITSIQISGESSSFLQYSTFYLYGVAKLGTTPAIVPYATGGDTIMTDGTYWYHAFLSSGTFTPQKGLSCDVLVVAGGGGGGANRAGGGGAGGLVSQTARSAANGIGYTVTIGAGGTGGIAAVSNGTSGSNTVFDTITSLGGGAGSGVSSSIGGSGGSGAGAQGGATTAGGSATQGNSGGGTGAGNAGGGGVASYNAAGGGGGAGAAGATGNTVSGQSGVGGIGLNTWSSWASVTSTGASGYFAGGGGGGGSNDGSPSGATAGAGGTGGGGAGNQSGAGVSGTANTGGGGGGGANLPAQNGGAGGSGIVIVRYAV
jgi:hypothetical protein